MYHIVKDAVSLTTMSSGKHRLTALSQRVSLFRTRRYKTPKFGQLTYFTSFRDIVNIAKIDRLYSWDVRDWCSDEKGFSTVLILSRKKQINIVPFDYTPSALVKAIIIKKWLLLIVWTFRSTHLSGICISLSNGGWRKIIYIYDDISLNNTNLNIWTF